MSKSAVSQEYSYLPEEANSKIEITSYQDQKILLLSESDTNRPLVITNVHYPGWRAFIDGKETKIYKADGIFQLIEVPKGSHKIDFKFRPQSFYNGLYISALAAVVTLIFTLVIWHKKYQ